MSAAQQTEAPQPELLPCPFCGATVEMEPYHHQTRASTNFIRCRNLDCNVMVETNNGDEAEAIAAWNRRSVPEGHARANELREAFHSVRAKALEEAAKVAESFGCGHNATGAFAGIVLNIVDSIRALSKADGTASKDRQT